MEQIRKCRMQDTEALAELFDSYRVFYKMESDKIQAKIFLKERIKNQDSVIYVSENEQSKLSGFIQLYPIFSSTRMQRLWLLNDLFVQPDQRGKGIAKKLILEAQQLCVESGSCGLILETAKSNQVGNKLYPSMGFQIDNDHNYYSWDS